MHRTNLFAPTNPTSKHFSCHGSLCQWPSGYVNLTDFPAAVMAHLLLKSGVLARVKGTGPGVTNFNNPLLRECTVRRKTW